MYTYRKISVRSVDCPKRFYRILYVREDLNLYQIGVTILTSLRAEFEHMFLFRDKAYTYVDPTWVSNFGFIPVKDYTTVHLSDLTLNAKNEFLLTYDTGDDWEFTVKICKKTVEIEDEELNEFNYGYAISAKGDRIWEDYHYTFWKYLNGEVDSKLLEEEGHPWNVPEGPLSQFDDEVDLEELNVDMDVAYAIAKMLSEQLH